MFSRRNPARRMSRRRRGFSRRNPPGDFIQDAFRQDSLTVAGGVLLGSTAPALLVNRMAASASMNKLPGITGTGYGRTAWKLGIALSAAYLLRNKAPRLAEGIMYGGVASAGLDVLNKSGAMSQISGAIAPAAAGTGRFFPGGRNGAGFLPGTNTRFTGPAQSFLTRNNAPRPGTGAMVGRNFVRNSEKQSEGAFRGAN